jgi:hypothetical protein
MIYECEELRSNDIDRGKLKNLEKIYSSATGILQVHSQINASLLPICG